MTLLCPGCGREFDRKPSEITNDRPCCSHACAVKFKPQSIPQSPGDRASRRLANNRASAERRKDLPRTPMARVAPKACPQCGAIFKPDRSRAKFCSVSCAVTYRHELQGDGFGRRSSLVSKIYVVNCDECRKLFIARRPWTKVCSQECRRKRDSRLTCEGIKAKYASDPEFRDLVISRAQNRHARKLGAGQITSPAALIDYLMKRDHRRCGICREPVRAKKGPRRPSIDHIMPLSRGGEHALVNLQLAHYRCNLAKNNGFVEGGEQLALIG